MASAPGTTVPDGGLAAGAAAPPLPSRSRAAVAAAGGLAPLLAAQAVAFALLAGSGKIPPLVFRVFRALLTL